MVDQIQHSCPECGPPKPFDNSHRDQLRKIPNEDFYRCSGCKNEWFEYEIVKTPYKTIKFKDPQNGKTTYLPMTPAKIEEWKLRNAGSYAPAFLNKQKSQFTSKDKNLLRKLRK